MTEIVKVVRLVKPFDRPLCPLPLDPPEGDTFTCQTPFCGTEYEAVLVEDGRVLWVATSGGCLHPFDRCEPAEGSVAVGVHSVLGAYECHDCGSWVVPLGEPVLLR